MTRSKPTVLFLCSANTARSQLAEALLRHIAGDRFESRSAGLEPGTAVHPLALRVLEERNIATAGLRAKNLTEYLGRVHVATVITVCQRAAERCPTTWPGILSLLHWDIEDPAEVEGGEEARLAAFRRVRDELESRIRDWLAASARTES